MTLDKVQKEMQDLTSENKLMKETLQKLGFSQEEIDNICNGLYKPSNAPVDPLSEVEFHEDRANRTLHGLANGLAYYNYEGIHFRAFKSFGDGLRWLHTRNDELVIADFDSEEGLDAFLGNYKDSLPKEQL